MQQRAAQMHGCLYQKGVLQVQRLVLVLECCWQVLLRTSV
jgi:hypothetical protein